MGDVNGIRLAQNAAGLSGLSALLERIIKPKIIGIETGSIRDWASCGSSFTTLPIAANNAA
jgi:hypothetical protein